MAPRRATTSRKKAAPRAAATATAVEAGTQVATMTTVLLAVAVVVGAISLLNAFAAGAASGISNLFLPRLTVDVVNVEQQHEIAPIDYQLAQMEISSSNDKDVHLQQLSMSLLTDLEPSDMGRFWLIDRVRGAIPVQQARYDQYNQTLTFVLPQNFTFTGTLSLDVFASVQEISSPRRIRVAIKPSEQVVAYAAKRGQLERVKVKPRLTRLGTKTVFTPGVTVIGTLDVMDANDQLRYDQDIQVTGGRTSDFLGAMQFVARYEDVLVKDFGLFVEDARVGLVREPNTTPHDDIRAVELVAADGTTIIGRSDDFQEGDYDGDADLDDTLVTFDNMNYTVSEGSPQVVYVRFIANEIGNGPEQIAYSGSHVDFQIAGGSFAVEGVESGRQISMDSASNPSPNDDQSQYDYHYQTNTATIYGATVSSITNDLSNGFLTNGQSVVGKYKITVDAGNNTSPTGTDASFNFEDVVVTFSYGGIDVDGTAAGDADFYYYLSSDPSRVVTVTDFIDGDTTDDVDLSSLRDFTGTETLVIEAAQVSGAGAAGDYLQTKLGSINDGHFEWNDGTNGETINGVALPYTRVAGGTLSN